MGNEESTPRKSGEVEPKTTLGIPLCGTNRQQRTLEPGMAAPPKRKRKSINYLTVQVEGRVRCLPTTIKW